MTPITTALNRTNYKIIFYRFDITFFFRDFNGSDGHFIDFTELETSLQ